MAKIPAAAQALIETWRLGFVATVSAAGKPNVSPKGTFVVLDDQTIAFAEMRSPNTRANIDHEPEVEVSFVDILSRRGVRFRGQCRVVGPGPEFDRLAPVFEAIWGPELKAMFNAIIVIPVDVVKPFQTPAYEIGATEAELRATWKAKVMEQPG